MEWRKKIFNIVETKRSSGKDDLYDAAMFVFIIMSLIPLAFREQTVWMEWFDKISVTAFIIDYILRWITADIKMPKYAKWKAFVLYPFTTMAIIDMLSIIPSFSIFNRAFKLFRLPRLLKILRIVRFFRYSKNIEILFRVLHKERRILATVFMLAVAYIFTTALIMFNLEESELFHDFFDALYWATTTLTTVGYGDIYPGSDLGRLISMLSAIIGVAIIALPSGVITASYLDELRMAKKEKEDKEKDKEDKAHE